MSRISEALKSKKAYIGFLTAGDPSLEKTEEYIIEIANAGAAVIEIGIPFSDPIAECSVVQEANVRALSAEGGCTTDMVFDMVERVSKKVSTPLVFMTYLNPIFKYGYEEFCKKCSETGVSGLIIPDMPYEEKPELKDYTDQYGIDIITLVSPASGDRIPKLVKEATGYVYILPSLDVKNEEPDVAQIVKVVRENTDTPIAVEYGLNTKKQLKEYSEIVDGIIVESAIVNLIAEHKENANKYIFDYVKSVVEGISN